jgi:hypothetical protein
VDYDTMCLKSGSKQTRTLNQWGARERLFPLIPTHRLEVEALDIGGHTRLADPPDAVAKLLQ